MEKGGSSNPELPSPEWVDDYCERVLVIAHEGLSRILELIRSDTSDSTE